MKKLTSFVLAIIAMSFVACGSKTESTNVKNDTDSLVVVDSTITNSIDSIELVNTLDSVN